MAAPEDPPPPASGGAPEGDDGPPRAPRSRETSRRGETILGRYRIEREIARGGMGIVYLATQIGLGRPVALKILAPKAGWSDPHFAQRFFLEASISAHLVHPNIVTVHDYGESERGEMFLVMEHLDGRSLADVISEGRITSLEQVLNIGAQICRALREAHARGVVHRDLKSSNVMILDSGDQVDGEHVKVLDFGLVKIVYPQAQLNQGVDRLELTETGRFLGSPRYVSPEQISGGQVDHRADIYSFGILLYQMTTGRLPFGGKDLIELAYQHMNTPLPPIEAGPDGRPVPPALSELILRCCAKDRESRHSSMDEVLGELRALGPGGLRSSGSTGPIRLPANLGKPGGPPVSAPPRGTSLGTASTETGEVRPLAEVPVDATSNNQLVPRPVSATSSPSKVPWIIATVSLAALIAAVAVFAVLALDVRERLLRPAPEPRTEVRVERVSSDGDQARVTFDSTPRGARVDENGVSLGTTPFLHTYEVEDSDPLHRFTFRLKGYEPANVETLIDVGRVTVHATLRARPDERRVTGSPDAAATRPEQAPATPLSTPLAATPDAGFSPPPDSPPVEAKPSGPAKVTAGVLERELLTRKDFQLPAAVRSAHRGEKLRIVVLVCTDKSGNVDPQRTRILTAPVGAEQSVLEAIRQWKYRPQAVPICGPVHFSVEVGR
ncbi:MAG: protein kinase [Deltaproteobacteria bacterium]|nr:protein kinase [Deltaproteobacteria bacterium]